MNMADTFRISPSEVRKRDTVERISVLHLTPAEFIDKYEKCYRPVVISDIQLDWPAKEKWTLSASRSLFLDLLMLD